MEGLPTTSGQRSWYYTLEMNTASWCAGFRQARRRPFELGVCVAPSLLALVFFFLVRRLLPFPCQTSFLLQLLSRRALPHTLSPDDLGRRSVTPSPVCANLV